VVIADEQRDLAAMDAALVVYVVEIGADAKSDGRVGGGGVLAEGDVNAEFDLGIGNARYNRALLVSGLSVSAAVPPPSLQATAIAVRETQTSSRPRRANSRIVTYSGVDS
jgi:hypothetical protein